MEFYGRLWTIVDSSCPPSWLDGTFQLKRFPPDRERLAGPSYRQIAITNPCPMSAAPL